MGPTEKGDALPARSAASLLERGDAGGIRSRQARYAHIRSILSEKVGELIVLDGFELNLRGGDVLEMVADDSSQAELLRQSMPLIEEALAGTGIKRVRLKHRPA